MVEFCGFWTEVLFAAEIVSRRMAYYTTLLVHVIKSII